MRIVDLNRTVISRSKRVLFFPEGERYLYESVPVLNSLARDCDIEVHYLVRNEQFTISALPDPAKTAEISDMIVLHQCPPPPRLGQRLIAWLEKGLKALLPGRAGEWLLNTRPFVFLLAILDVIDLEAAKRQAERIFHDVNPDAFIIVRDRNLGQQTALTRLMREARRPVIIIPWGYPNAAFMLATRADSPRNHANGNCASATQRRLVQQNSPHIREFQGVEYSYYKPGRYIAAKWAGILPSHPWVFGADTDLCCVDSVATATVLIEGGVPSNLIEVTGNQIHDSLYMTKPECDDLRKSLAGRYETGSRPVLLFAVPHLPEHGLIDWDTHRAELRHVMAEIQRITGAAVLLSIHPRSDPSNYTFLTEEFGASRLVEPLRHALNGADMFVCHWSGTTVWGPLTEVPTLVLDYFKVPALGFEHLMDHLVVVSSKSELAAGLETLKSANARLRHVDLPPFDGRSTDRVVTAIRRRLGLAPRKIQCASA